MPCYKPGRGRQAPNGALTYYGHLQIAAGKLPPLPPNYKDIPLPCGKCTGCKIEHGRQWAVRLMHEARLHDKCCFITPTYSDAALLAKTEAQPVVESDTRTRETHAHGSLTTPASLSKRDLQLFTKRLNQSNLERFGKGVKYYAVGEYGERTWRPHYHIAVFGEDFSDDRQPWKRSPSGHQLWRSSRLTRLWPHGTCDIGELTFESAAYIARYIMKKITGSKADDHYRRENERGETYWLEPEFSVMSRRPGIGREWFLQFKNDVYPHDHVISRGHPAKPPRYYDKLLEMLAPYEHELIKQQRANAPRNEADQRPERLEAREIVALAKLKQNKRSLE